VRPDAPPLPSPALPPGPPAITERPAHGPAADDPHGLGLRDGTSGAALSEQALTERLRTARAIYVGEQHDSPASHRMQLHVLAMAYRLDPSVAVGLEMLPRSLQPQLDAYVVGSVDEAGFLRAVDWPHTWGFDFALYRPIFEFCRAHGVRMHALNAPRALSKAVRQKGVDGLVGDERAGLPSGYPWPTPAPHQQLLREVWNHHAKPDPAAPASQQAEREAAFQRFYTAQLIWDEAMSQAITEIFTDRADRSAPQRLIVLAGTGHVGRHAVPERAVRRGAPSGLTLGPAEAGEIPHGAEALDVLYRIEAESK
jgi:uncharacterized iron-regulated protein